MTMAKEHKTTATLELGTMRMFCLIAAVSVVVTGFVSQSTYDPLTLRVFVIVISFLPLILSFVSSFVRKNFSYFLYPMYLSLFTWEGMLAYHNNYSVEEAISTILILVLAGIVPYKKYSHFVFHLVYCALVDLIVIYLLPQSFDNRLTYATYIVVGGSIAFLMAGSRAKILSALQEGWSRLQSVADSAHDMILSVNDKGKIIFWNLSASKILGYSEEEIIGKDISFILPSGAARVGGRAEARKKNGGTVDVEVTVGAYNGDTSKSTTLILRDVTEKMIYEEQLRLRNEELEKLNKLMVGRELRMRELKKQIANKAVNPGDSL